MKFVSFVSNLFNSRIFYMFGIFIVFVGIALENVMRTANFHIGASLSWILILIVPVPVLFLLISAFLIVMKRRWADIPAAALLFLGLLLHRPTAYFEHLYSHRGFFARIYDLPFNYFYYSACIFLIVFLIVQIMRNKYKITFR